MLVVVQRILVHAEQLVRLRETVPSSVIFPVDICVPDAITAFQLSGNFLDRLLATTLTDGFAVCLDGRMRVFHLDVFMAHQRPRRQVRPVKLSSASEIFDRFFVLGTERIIVPLNAKPYFSEWPKIFPQEPYQ